jgi:DNA-binding beta-propeller fold protein YncE
VVVVEDQTTTHNVALTSPIATIDDSPVVDTVAPGDTMVYNRYLYNTGSATLTYNVSLNFDVGPLLTIHKNFVTERIANVIDPNGNADVAPYSFNNGSLPVITDFMDSVFCLDLAYLLDTHLLGIEFDGTYFWITGGNSGLDPNKLYKLDATGVLVNTYNQSSSAGWGWRDLAWDGQYLYGSDNNFLVQIDPATGLVTGVTIPGPTNPCRGLAYDPVSDHFFTANFGSGNSIAPALLSTPGRTPRRFTA